MNCDQSVHPRLASLVDSGEIEVGDYEICETFLDHISNEYPLIPHTFDSVDWSKTNDTVSSNVENLSASELAHFIRTTTIHKYEWIGLIYSRSHCSYVMSIDVFLKHFDVLASIIPHIGFFVGIERVGEKYEYHHDDFLEWELDEGMFLSGKGI